MPMERKASTRLRRAVLSFCGATDSQSTYLAESSIEAPHNRPSGCSPSLPLLLTSLRQPKPSFSPFQAKSCESIPRHTVRRLATNSWLVYAGEAARVAELGRLARVGQWGAARDDEEEVLPRCFSFPGSGGPFE